MMYTFRKWNRNMTSQHRWFSVGDQEEMELIVLSFQIKTIFSNNIWFNSSIRICETCTLCVFVFFSFAFVLFCFCFVLLGCLFVCFVCVWGGVCVCVFVFVFVSFLSCTIWISIGIQRLLFDKLTKLTYCLNYMIYLKASLISLSHLMVIRTPPRPLISYTKNKPFNPNRQKSYKMLQRLSPKHAARGVVQSP